MRFYEGSYEQRGISLRALAAHDDGRVPISGVNRAWLDSAGLDLPVGFAKWLLRKGHGATGEWHHTGKFAAERPFHDPEVLAEFWRQLTPLEQTAMRSDYDAERKRPVGEPVERRVSGTYDEWVGSRRWGRFKSRGFTGTLRGNWIHLDGGGRKQAHAKHIQWKFDGLDVEALETAKVRELKKIWAGVDIDIDRLTLRRIWIRGVPYSPLTGGYDPETDPRYAEWLASDRLREDVAWALA